MSPTKGVGCTQSVPAFSMPQIAGGSVYPQHVSNIVSGHALLKKKTPQPERSPDADKRSFIEKFSYVNIDHHEVQSDTIEICKQWRFHAIFIWIFANLPIRSLQQQNKGTRKVHVCDQSRIPR
jgi:hypothetical protein